MVAPKQVKEKMLRVWLATYQDESAGLKKKKVLVSVTLPYFGFCGGNNRISFYWCVTFLSSFENGNDVS